LASEPCAASIDGGSPFFRDHCARQCEALRCLERAGVLRVVATRRLGFAPTLRNTSTFGVWEPMSAT
jgi:hypothetical protein